jgi:hypothetical protein
MRALKWDNAVPEQAKAVDPMAEDSVVPRQRLVQPGGHPMRCSTNSGFKLRPALEDFAPGVEVIGSRREERRFAWPASNNSSDRSPERLVWPPVEIATVGAHHCAAWAASGIPPPWPNAWFGAPFSPSDARTADQSLALAGSDGFEGPRL